MFKREKKFNALITKGNYLVSEWFCNPEKVARDINSMGDLK